MQPSAPPQWASAPAPAVSAGASPANEAATATYVIPESRGEEPQTPRCAAAIAARGALFAWDVAAPPGPSRPERCSSDPAAADACAAVGGPTARSLAAAFHNSHEQQAAVKRPRLQLDNSFLAGVPRVAVKPKPLPSPAALPQQPQALPPALSPYQIAPAAPSQRQPLAAPHSRRRFSLPSAASAAAAAVAAAVTPPSAVAAAAFPFPFLRVRLSGPPRNRSVPCWAAVASAASRNTSASASPCFEQQLTPSYMQLLSL